MTDEQRAYLLEHINDRPRTEVAKAVGLSVWTVWKFARENGGEMLYRHSDSYMQIVIDNYRNMSGREIVRRFGIPQTSVYAIVRRLGLKHSPEFIQGERNRLSKLHLLRSKEAIMRGARKRQIKMRMEEMRVWEGKEQLTKFRLKSMCNKDCRIKSKLIRKYNYFAIEGEPYVLYYDSQTRRLTGRNSLGRINSRSSESYYTKKYGFTFAPADEN